MVLLAGPTSKAGPYILSPCSSSFKRHVPGWVRSSWATEGRSTPVVFLCQRPRVAVRNDVPNRAQPGHGVICPPRRDVHITDNMPGCTNTFSTTSVHPASSSPSQASWAAWPSSGLAIARPPSSGPHLQTTRGIRVRCTCRHSFPIPYPYSRGTLSSPTTRVTRSRAGSDTIPRSCRIPMPMGVHPPSKTKRRDQAGVDSRGRWCVETGVAGKTPTRRHVPAPDQEGSSRNS